MPSNKSSSDDYGYEPQLRALNREAEERASGSKVQAEIYEMDAKLAGIRERNRLKRYLIPAKEHEKK